ncbi:hypothetical protein PSSHI_27180 [Photobacterium sp. R1]
MERFSNKFDGNVINFFWGESDLFYLVFGPYYTGGQRETRYMKIKWLHGWVMIQCALTLTKKTDYYFRIFSSNQGDSV